MICNSTVNNLSELISGFQRDGVPLAESRGSAFGGVWGNAPQSVKRSAKGVFPNSPQDCLERGNALQERAFPYKEHGTL